jgi:hypothetical protein
LDFHGITYQSDAVLDSQLPDVINAHLVDVTASIPALDLTELANIRDNLNELPPEFCVPIATVLTRLNIIKVLKSSCPDGIPNKILSASADVLATPITAFLSSSIRQGIVPQQWTDARITPLPKV